LIPRNAAASYVRLRTEIVSQAVYVSNKFNGRVGPGGRQQRLDRGLALWTSCSYEGVRMNWDRIQGNWKQVVGKAKAQWGKLTDDDLDVVAGRREQLAGKIQERYGLAKDDVERQIADWELKATDAWFVEEKKRS
jgi:uncharacterized protein YjbJ (UPF0337 family)